MTGDLRRDGGNAEFCGTDCGNFTTPAGKILFVARFNHDPHCQCGQGGILMLQRHIIRGIHLGNVGL
jgi:hypothetical protein